MNFTRQVVRYSRTDVKPPAPVNRLPASYKPIGVPIRRPTLALPVMKLQAPQGTQEITTIDQNQSQNVSLLDLIKNLFKHRPV